MHFRVDPEREIDAGATEVHGMTWDDLKGKPKFREVAAEFVDFARGAEWIIHNAPFDVGFLDAELELAAHPALRRASTRALVDTLALARDMFPGKRNSLDALCERFGVDNAHRSVHGALLDAQLLAEVYLAMTRGQETLTIDMARAVARGRFARRRIAADGRVAPRAALRLIAPTGGRSSRRTATTWRRSTRETGRALRVAALAASADRGRRRSRRACSSACLTSDGRRLPAEDPDREGLRRRDRDRRSISRRRCRDGSATACC